jgi:hypothetical protein
VARARIGLCRLHQDERLLMHGHVIPAFVHRWQGTGSRTISRPNLRREDGPRRHMFCSACEELLSGWETKTKHQIFDPLHDGRSTTFAYGPWFARLAASVLFRVLLASKEDGALAEFPADSLMKIDEALDTWRIFMLGARQEPGGFRVLAFVLNPVSDDSAEQWTPGINMFLTLAVSSDVVRTNRGCFVITKMGRLLVIGIVENSGDWNSGAIGADGVLRSVDPAFPTWLRQWFNDKAARSMAAFGQLSERQKQKIRAETGKRRFARRVMEAFRNDIRLFGWNAVMAKFRRG